MAFDMTVLPGANSFGFHPNHAANSSMSDFGARQRTLHPMVTTTSVLGVKFDGGVMLAADLGGYYGTLAKLRNCPRLLKVNDQIIVGAGGDYADYQFLKGVMDQKVISEECLNDGFKLKPKSLYSWLTRVMYNRRSKFDPLWNTYLVGGLQDGVPFLGQVDMLGTAFQSDTLATGYGAYIAQPLMRDDYEKKGGHLSQEEAKDTLVKSLRVLYYRDGRSLDKYQLAVVTAEGVKIEGPFQLDSNWELAHLVKGYE
uniref:Proteasome subunit beta n=1 Tax=Ixodes ricinus TaxID=34613 RepID=A0A0K8RM43_IXORI